MRYSALSSFVILLFFDCVWLNSRLILCIYLDKIVDINYVVRTVHIISILQLVTLINNVIPYVAYVLLRKPSKHTYIKSKVTKVTRQ